MNIRRILYQNALIAISRTGVSHEDLFRRAAVELTHISAYGTHKNLAVRKIMKAMRTEYA